MAYSHNSPSYLMRCTLFAHHSFMKYLEQTLKAQLYVAIIETTGHKVRIPLGKVVEENRSRHYK